MGTKYDLPLTLSKLDRRKLLKLFPVRDTTSTGPDGFMNPNLFLHQSKGSRIMIGMRKRQGSVQKVIYVDDPTREVATIIRFEVGKGSNASVMDLFTEKKRAVHSSDSENESLIIFGGVMVGSAIGSLLASTNLISATGYGEWVLGVFRVAGLCLGIWCFLRARANRKAQYLLESASSVPA